MQDIKNKVNKDAMNNARANRQSVTNPPDNEPGMGMDDLNIVDSFFNSDDGDTGELGNSSGGGINIGGNNGDMWGNPTTNPFQQQAPQQPDDGLEDKFFDVLKGFFVGFKDWAKNFGSSFKTFDLAKRLIYGRTVMLLSAIMLGVGILTAIFGWKNGMQLVISSLLTGAFGVIMFMFSFEKINKNGGIEALRNSTQPNDEQDNETIDLFGDDDDELNISNNGNFVVDDDDDDEVDISFDEPISFDEDDDIVSPVVEEVPKTTANPTSVLNTIDIDRGMVTRQYLFEKVCQILPSCSAEFDKVTEYGENSEDFEAWDTIVQQSAEILRTGNQEDMPYLLAVKDKLLYYQLDVHRVKWIKNVDSLVNEIVNICKYDDNGKEDKSVYGTGVYVGTKAIIKIMKGTTAKVSIGDAYKKVKDFILNTKNEIPVVWGIDLEGEVIVRDLKDIHSLCVAGMPRSGKTWLVQSILFQMMLYKKPSELQFYIYDPKDTVSDFKAMTMPHIKEFKSKDEDIVRGLRYIVRNEAARRTKIIGDADCVNIDDFKKKNPNVEMPLLYVVIDEVITFASRMKSENPELEKEFQGYLKELVSRLPNLGIRLFMIPHVIKDAIISKTTTDLIPCRVSVRGTSEHIESVTGAKPKDFTHKLNHVGDMAIKLNDEVEFCHGAILSATNDENNNLFNFLTQLWLKIEPESIKGSVYERVAQENNIKNELTQLRNTDDNSVTDRSWDTDNKNVTKPKVNFVETELPAMQLGNVATNDLTEVGGIDISWDSDDEDDDSF